jgi:pentatricopeptide repeat protein
MEDFHLEPDDVTLTSLLDICLAQKQKAAIDHIVKLLLKDGRVLDSCTCNLFIKGLIRVGRLPKAMEVYAALKASSAVQSKPTIVTYSMLIKALAGAHNLEDALLILQDMNSAGAAPDEIIFTHLVDGCRLVGNHQLGEKLFKDMLAAGIRPSEYTLTMMVKLYGRCGALDKAYNLVESWEAEHGARPSVIHFTCLMSGCLRGKQQEKAWNAYELMEKRGIAADATLISTLMPAMITKQRYDRVLQLARRALQKPGGVALPAEFLNDILSKLKEAPDAHREAEEMLRLLQE